MSNFRIDIEQQLTNLGREIQQFVERMTPMEHGKDFSPACDIIESRDALKIMVDLPGMEKDQIRISLKNRVLTVEGTRELYLEDHEKLKREERAQGAFIRSFSVPAHADTGSVEASFKNGVLTIKISKKGDDDSEANSIPIN